MNTPYVTHVATVDARINWHLATGTNLIGFVPGKKYSGSKIVHWLIVAKGTLINVLDKYRLCDMEWDTRQGLHPELDVTCMSCLAEFVKLSNAEYIVWRT